MLDPPNKPDAMNGLCPDWVSSQDSQLRHLARKITRDDAEAEDLVQETWLIAVERIAQAKNRSAWLQGILRSLVGKRRRSEVRRRLREHSIEPRRGSEDPTRHALELELTQTLEDALAQLSPEEAETIRLRVLEELPYIQIGTRLGVSPDSARSRVRRGLDRMQSRIEATWRAGLSAVFGLRRPQERGLTRLRRTRLLSGTQVVPALLLTSASLLLLLGLGLRTAGLAEAPLPFQANTLEAGQPRLPSTLGGLTRESAMEASGRASLSPDSDIASTSEQPPSTSERMIRVLLPNKLPARDAGGWIVEDRAPALWRGGLLSHEPDVRGGPDGSLVVPELAQGQGLLIKAQDSMFILGVPVDSLGWNQSFWRPGSSAALDLHDLPQTLELLPCRDVLISLTSTTGEAILNGQVRFRGSFLTLRGARSASATNQYSLASIPLGCSGTLSLSAKGFGSRRLEFDVIDTAEHMQLTLQPAQPITVQVLDSAGIPLRGCRVDFFQVETESIGSLGTNRGPLLLTDRRLLARARATDEQGKLRRLDLAPGEYLVRVDDGQRLLHQENLRLVAGATKIQQLVVNPANHPVRILVLHRELENGIRIQAKRLPTDGQGQELVEGRTLNATTSVIDGVVPGKWLVWDPRTSPVDDQDARLVEAHKEARWDLRGTGVTAAQAVPEPDAE